jgi:ribokinase
MGRVVVVGSINVDLVVTAERFPRPGETIIGRSFERHPGGKGANQSIAAARLGALTIMVGAVGDDAFGNFMRTVFIDAGVDAGAIRTVPDESTGIALITVARGENSIVVIGGANGHLSPADALFPLAADDVVVAQLETPAAATRAAFEAARAVGAATILNPAPASRDAVALLPLADVVVVNETELELLAGTLPSRTTDGPEMVSAVRALRRYSGQTVIVTLGACGLIAVAASDDPIEIAGHAVDVTDTTGAGDCFVGALAAGLAAGTDLRSALARANAAAALSVERVGAGSSMPTAAEVDAFLAPWLAE